MTDIKKAIGFRVKAARESCRISQEKLAEYIGVSTNTVSRLETGREMTSIEKLYQISQVLNIDFSYLVSDLSNTAEDAPDQTELEIIRKLHHMPEKGRRHLLEYINLFLRYTDDNTESKK